MLLIRWNHANVFIKFFKFSGYKRRRPAQLTDAIPTSSLYIFWEELISQQVWKRNIFPHCKFEWLKIINKFSFGLWSYFWQYTECAHAINMNFTTRWRYDHFPKKWLKWKSDKNLDYLYFLKTVFYSVLKIWICSLSKSFRCIFYFYLQRMSFWRKNVFISLVQSVKKSRIQKSDLTQGSLLLKVLINVWFSFWLFFWENDCITICCNTILVWAQSVGVPRDKYRFKDPARICW